MGITHIVLFQFKPDLTAEVIKDACAQVIALKENCIHPSTGKPYIRDFRGGEDNSPEGMQSGITHAFVAEFETAEDRDYYVSQDPVHLGLGKRINQFVEKVQVVDFTHRILLAGKW